MKVLVVSPYPVLPLTHGARVRTFRLAAAVAGAGARVDLLAPWSPGQPVRPFTREGVVCHPHFFLSNALPFVLRGRGVPSQVALSLRPVGLGPRRRLSAFDGYDVAQFDLCAHAGWMGRLPRAAKVVYSAHNVERDYLTAQPDRWLAPRVAMRRLTALERRAVGASDLVVTCTDRDAERLAGLYGQPPRFEVVPNGFHEGLLDSDRARLREPARASLGLSAEQTALVFIGGPAQHNRHAVRFLEGEVMPRVDSRMVLFVVGQSGGRRDSTRSGRVRRLGVVDDLRPVLAASDVGVNPVAFGSGSSVKVAEYLGAGLPIVTTPLGARGFERQRDRLHVTPLDRFATAVRSLSGGRVERNSPVPELRWSELGRRLHATYERLLE
jgi:glycosyltransferase involved in cell wall biosynthesis